MMKFSFVIAAIPVIGISVALHFLSTAPTVLYKRFSTDLFSLEIPDGSRVEKTQYKQWKGYRFKGFGDASIHYYRVTKKVPIDHLLSDTAGTVKRVKFQEHLPFFDGALFLLASPRKNLRRYIYIICSGEYVFWIENYSKNSTLNIFKKVADTMAMSLQVNGKPSSTNINEQIRKIDSKVIFYSQSPRHFYYLLTGSALFFIAFMCIISYFSGKIPKNLKEHIIRKEGFVFLKKRSKFRFNLSVVATILTDRALYIFEFGKPIVTVVRGQSHGIQLLSGRRSNFLRCKDGDLTTDIFVSEPSRWMNDIQC